MRTERPVALCCNPVAQATEPTSPPLERERNERTLKPTRRSSLHPPVGTPKRRKRRLTQSTAGRALQRLVPGVAAVQRRLRPAPPRAQRLPRRMGRAQAGRATPATRGTQNGGHANARGKRGEERKGLRGPAPMPDAVTKALMAAQGSWRDRARGADRADCCVGKAHKSLSRPTPRSGSRPETSRGAHNHNTRRSLLPTRGATPIHNAGRGHCRYRTLPTQLSGLHRAGGRSHRDQRSVGRQRYYTTAAARGGGGCGDHPADAPRPPPDPARVTRRVCPWCARAGCAWGARRGGGAVAR